MRNATTHTTNSLTAFSGHRFHFNGKETDNEVYGEGNVYDYGERIYKSRIGRFLSIDPLTKDYPMFSPYQTSSNSPIGNIDLDGLEGISYLLKGQFKQFGEAWRRYRFMNTNTFQEGTPPSQMNPVVPPPLQTTIDFGGYNRTNIGTTQSTTPLTSANQFAISKVVGTLRSDPLAVISIQGSSNGSYDGQPTIQIANDRAITALNLILSSPQINSRVDEQGNPLKNEKGELVDINNKVVVDDNNNPILANRFTISPPILNDNAPVSATITVIPGTALPPPAMPKEKSVLIKFLKFTFGNTGTSGGGFINRNGQSTSTVK